MVNQLSFLIFSMLLDTQGYDRIQEFAQYSIKFELIYIVGVQRIPYRSFQDYLESKYRM